MAIVSPSVDLVVEFYPREVDFHTLRPDVPRDGFSKWDRSMNNAWTEAVSDFYRLSGFPEARPFLGEWFFVHVLDVSGQEMLDHIIESRVPGWRDSDGVAHLDVEKVDALSGGVVFTHLGRPEQRVSSIVPEGNFRDVDMWSAMVDWSDEPRCFELGRCQVEIVKRGVEVHWRCQGCLGSGVLERTFGRIEQDSWLDSTNSMLAHRHHFRNALTRRLADKMSPSLAEEVGMRLVGMRSLS